MRACGFHASPSGARQISAEAEAKTPGISASPWEERIRSVRDGAMRL
jgi:hypothetical protein